MSIGAPECDTPRSTVSSTSRPTISSASSSSVVSLGLRSPITLPRRMTVIRSAISSTSYSLWLMKMIDRPSSARRRSRTKISSVSCGREHRGRLVEDQDPRLAVEGLEDLDTLLLPHRQRADLRVRVQLEAEPAASSAIRVLASVRSRKTAVGHRLGAEDHVLGDGQNRDQHEVLVDHADAAGDRVRRAGDLDRLAVEQDLPLVGPGQAVQDVHERRLAGAVLAEQGVDLAAAGRPGRCGRWRRRPG